MSENYSENVEREISQAIKRARRFGATLTRADFRVYDGYLVTIDGMSANDWIDAVLVG